MAVSVTVTNISTSGPKYFVTFADGSQLEFQSLAAMTAWTKEIEDVPTTQRLAVGFWIARDDDANNPNVIVGKTLTFDISNNNPIRVQ